MINPVEEWLARIAESERERDEAKAEVAHLPVVLANVREGAAELRRRFDVAEKERDELRAELDQVCYSLGLNRGTTKNVARELERSQLADVHVQTELRTQLAKANEQRDHWRRECTDVQERSRIDSDELRTQLDQAIAARYEMAATVLDGVARVDRDVAEIAELRARLAETREVIRNALASAALGCGMISPRNEAELRRVMEG